MQIKVEKEPYSLNKAARVYSLLFLLYFALTIAPSLWADIHSWQSVPFVRWLNLLLIPLVFSLIITRASRKAHLYLTHLPDTLLIRQRLVQAFEHEGYIVDRELPRKVYLRSRFFLWDTLLGKGALRLKERNKCVQISGCWSKIHRLEKLTHEGEILLPNPR